MSAVFAGFGGGSGNMDVGSTRQLKFLLLPRSSGGDRVIDGSGHEFGFYADNGCLLNVQTGQENTAFCLAPNCNVVTNGAFPKENIRCGRGRRHLQRSDP